MARRPARPCQLYVPCSSPATHRFKLRAFASGVFPGRMHWAAQAEGCERHARRWLRRYGPLRRPAVYRFRRLS